MENKTIEIIPSIELVGAAYAYIMYRTDKQELFSENLESSPRIVEWKKQVADTISPFLENDLRFFFQYATHYILLCRLVLQKNLTKPEELITFLRNIREVDFSNLYKAVLQLEESPQEELTPEILKKAIEADRSMYKDTVPEEAEQLYLLFRHPEEFKQKLATSLDTFYQRFLKTALEKDLNFLESKRKTHQELLTNDPIRFLNQITNDNYQSLFPEGTVPRIIIQFYHEKGLDIFMSGGPFILYGFAHEQRLDNQSICDKTDTYLKAFADPKRIAVLRLLKKRKWYGKELATFFGISTATMSYHLEKLIVARLVHFETSDKNRLMYSLNKEGIKDMIESIKKEFLY